MNDDRTRNYNLITGGEGWERCVSRGLPAYWCRPSRLGEHTSSPESGPGLFSTLPSRDTETLGATLTYPIPGCYTLYNRPAVSVHGVQHNAGETHGNIRARHALAYLIGSRVVASALSRISVSFSLIRSSGLLELLSRRLVGSVTPVGAHSRLPGTATHYNTVHSSIDTLGSTTRESSSDRSNIAFASP